MILGTCIIELYLPGVHSLKEKRRILKSLIARLHREFNISCAEVALHDAWQSASIGVAVVTTSQVHAQDVIRTVMHWIERNRPEIDIVGETVEILY
ncbi:MAG: DUF503 domain-containing protein [Chloroflexi bacterium]|nr:DUF503 domain-containing protein [Chloroflexota bacterium]